MRPCHWTVWGSLYCPLLYSPGVFCSPIEMIKIWVASTKSGYNPPKGEGEYWMKCDKSILYCAASCSYSFKTSLPPPTPSLQYTVPKEIDFPRYNMKCSGENVISCYIAEIWIAFLTVYELRPKFWTYILGIRVRRTHSTWNKCNTATYIRNLSPKLTIL